MKALRALSPTADLRECCKHLQQGGDKGRKGQVSDQFWPSSSVLLWRQYIRKFHFQKCCFIRISSFFLLYFFDPGFFTIYINYLPPSWVSLLDTNNISYLLQVIDKIVEQDETTDTVLKLHGRTAFHVHSYSFIH